MNATLSEYWEHTLWAALTGGILARILDGPLSVQFFVAMFAYAALSTWWVNYLNKRELRKAKESK